MVKMKFGVYFLFALCSAELVNGRYFTVIGPRTVQFKENYTVFVTATDDYHDDDHEVFVSLRGNQFGDEIGISHFPSGYVNESVTFDLTKSNIVQNYTLIAAINRTGFKQSVEIITILKQYSVLIQTDKPLYKPGDKVNFRVLIVDVEMKLYRAKKMRIEILDGLSNVVREFNDNLELGIFVSNFEIASETTLGGWTIRVITNDQMEDERSKQDLVTDYYFETQEIVVPRFNVIIDTNRDITQNSQVVRLNVYAEYASNVFVQGTAVITARVFDSKYLKIVQHTTSKTVSIDTKKMVDFNIRNDLKVMHSIRPFNVHFVVNFTETLTGETLSSDINVRIHKFGAYSIELVRERERFKPGFPYKLEAIIRKLDGTLVKENRFSTLQLTVNYYYKPLMYTTLNIHDLEARFESQTSIDLVDGTAKFEIPVPKNTSALAIRAQYLGVEAVLYVKRQLSKIQEYLKIEAETIRSKKVVKVTVNGSENLNEVYSIVIGRTGIIHQFTHNFENVNSSAFNIPITKLMAPVCSLIVYYISDDEIVYDRMRLKFDIPLENQLELTLMPSKSKYGSNCFIKGRTSPYSTVYLLGIDQSASLFSGNDIDNYRLDNELRSYSEHETNSELRIDGLKGSRYQDLGDFNAFILTNAYGLEIEDEYEDEYEDGCGSGETEKVYTPERPTVRKSFPETWIFEEVKADSVGKFLITKKFPTTLGSFLVSAFSVNPDTGLGIANQQKIAIIPDFVLRLDMPYSIKIGETLKIDVSVLYPAEKHPRRVTRDKPREILLKMMKDDQGFEFVDATPSENVCNVAPSDDDHRTKSVKVFAGSIGSTFFLIRPLKTGVININVKGNSAKYIDEIERTILVEHEGISEFRNVNHLIDLRNQNLDAYSFNIAIPTDHIIFNSIEINASVAGDLLGPAFANIQSLIQIPSGTTEQQLKDWIPSISAIRYLQAINKLTSEYQTKGENFLTTGYQQLLSKRKQDSTLWGETGEKSVWLTAFVARNLGYAKELIPINDKHIVEALNFVKEKQKPDGSFSDQVKKQQGVPLTAFVAVAFLENAKFKTTYKSTIDNAIGYIVSQITQMEDNADDFAMAISAYALSLNAHSDTNALLDQLKSNAIIRHYIMFWNPSDNPSINVEIAAYAIMAFVTARRSIEAIPIMNWLMTQRSNTGGFYTSADTVVGIQALAMIATTLHTSNVNMNINLRYDKDQKIDFDINQHNALTWQNVEMAQDSRRYMVTANGTGFAYFQVSYRFNTLLNPPARGFNLTAEVQKNSNPNLLHLKICAKYINQEPDIQSQTTLIEVFLPSGYVYDPQTAELGKSAGVKRTETHSRKTVVVLYFDTITKDDVCPEVKAIRQNVVADLKPSVVKIYEYNNRNNQASQFYMPSSGKPCGF